MTDSFETKNGEINEMQLSEGDDRSRTLIDTHLSTLPLSHAAPPTRSRPAAWLRASATVGVHPPLFLIQDIGAILTQPRDRLKLGRPAHLPEDVDTSAYLNFLTRVAGHPLVREMSRWDISDTMAGVVSAKLMSEAKFPDKYVTPVGTEAVEFAGRLSIESGRTDPARVWRETDPGKRPDLTRLLPPDAMAGIEAGLRRLHLDELRFLHRYGPGMAGAPDPKDLLDLFSLLELPPAVRMAVSQVLRLTPGVSQTTRTGGVQTYTMGGYEGLAHKGSLDSIVPTELAYPNTIFIHRILNQEALYYGREGEQKQRKELAYIITQSGMEMMGDADALSRGLTLALVHTMQRRGYEVWQSFAGSELTPPARMNRPGDVHRILYYQERGWLKPGDILTAVSAQLRSWKEAYRGKQVFWVLGEHWDADHWETHQDVYKALKREAGHQAWFIRMGKSGPERNGARPAVSGCFHRYHIIESSLMWKERTLPAGYGEGNKDPGLAKPKPRIRLRLGMEFVYIPPGTFMMGSPEDEPGRFDNEKLHKVTLTKGFYMQTTQVTQGQWKALMGENPSYFKNGDDYPVETVSWEDTQEFIRKLNEMEKTDKYRLPTEAEWEYACRAGTDTPFYFGRCLSTDQANYNGNFPLEGCPKGEWRKRTVPVASFPANAYGLYDMHGNVNEWCQYVNSNEWCQEDIYRRPGSGPVFRGGGWSNAAGICRSAFRVRLTPVIRYRPIGLRLAFSPGQ